MHDSYNENFLTSVWVARNEGVGHHRDLLDEGSHLHGPQSTVQSDAETVSTWYYQLVFRNIFLQETVPEWFCVADAGDKCLSRLAGECPPAFVDDRARHHDGKLLIFLVEKGLKCE